VPYTYGDANWKDKLTAYNGVVITYDAIGNPLNDGAWNYTWTSGRQLSQMSKDGMSVLFKYDHNGLRSQKSVTENAITTTTDYIYHGKFLVAMTRGSDVLRFEYDAQSRPSVVMYNDTRYAYLHNLQGDIVAIVNASDTVVLRYSYDAWGYPTHGDPAAAYAVLDKANPFRYRGYVWDEESELYCLKTRWYYPNYNRFISLDSVIDYRPILLSGMRYAYAQMNPIIYVDDSGEIARRFDNCNIESCEEIGFYDRYKGLTYYELSSVREEYDSLIFLYWEEPELWKDVLANIFVKPMSLGISELFPVASVLADSAKDAYGIISKIKKVDLQGMYGVSGFIATYIQSVPEATYDVIVYSDQYESYIKIVVHAPEQPAFEYTHKSNGTSIPFAVWAILLRKRLYDKPYYHYHTGLE